MTVASFTIWTIGHSTRTIEEFIDLLREHEIEMLVDVRHFPSSRRYPQFNKPELAGILGTVGIRYEHLVELGGRRPVRRDSHNLRWRNASFRGYADYMETQPFRQGMERLIKISHTGRTSIMCSEAVWWRCHRSMISDDLKAKGTRVVHIMSLCKTQEHPYTSAALLVDGRLSYKNPSLFDPDPLLQETQPMTRIFKAGDHVEWNSKRAAFAGRLKKELPPK